LENIREAIAVWTSAEDQKAMQMIPAKLTIGDPSSTSSQPDVAIWVPSIDGAFAVNL
jgi:hypothetical protein